MPLEVSGLALVLKLEMSTVRELPSPEEIHVPPSLLLQMPNARGEPGVCVKRGQAEDGYAFEPSRCMIGCQTLAKLVPDGASNRSQE
jgi:hypothetical protein